MNIRGFRSTSSRGLEHFSFATRHLALYKASVSQNFSTIGRLAPSPTGAQHVGNARTYLIAWLSAPRRAAKSYCASRILIRRESSRGPLRRPATICVGLDWIGTAPVVQTQRLLLYQEALERLKQLDLVYPCTCTRTDIERAASAPHAEHEGPLYPGTCAGRSAVDAESLCVPYAWRMRVGERPMTFNDGFVGATTIDLRMVGGDFVVWKSAGTPAYQLAVVVDDAAQGITEVVRGLDLLPSTPRQLLLYRALGLAPPRFIHVPLVVGPDGRRLAKRHGDTRLTALRRPASLPNCCWVRSPGPVAGSARYVPSPSPNSCGISAWQPSRASHSC